MHTLLCHTWSYCQGFSIARYCLRDSDKDSSLDLHRSNEAGGARGAVGPPIIFSTELCPISSAHKNILKVLDGNSGRIKLLPAIFGFIFCNFLDREI